MYFKRVIAGNERLIKCFNNHYLLMVYGSMMKGNYNHSYIESDTVKFVGTATTVDSRYKMLSINEHYPVIVEGNDNFTGEVYDISGVEMCLRPEVKLGVPVYLRRGFAIAKINNGEEKLVLIYYKKDESYCLPESKYIRYVDGIYTWTGSKKYGEMYSRN